MKIHNKKSILLGIVFLGIGLSLQAQGLNRNGQFTSNPSELLNGTGAIGTSTLVSKNGEKEASFVLYQNYQGGKIFYFFKPGDPGYDENKTKGLIAAVNVIKDPVSGSNPVWSTKENLTTGATADGVGAGKTNTATILANDANARAAISVSDYSPDPIDGVIYDDWYLPSLAEGLLFLADYRKMYSANILYGIWTSNEVSSSQARYISSTTKASGDWSKNRSFFSVVAIRQF